MIYKRIIFGLLALSALNACSIKEPYIRAEIPIPKVYPEDHSKKSDTPQNHFISEAKVTSAEASWEKYFQNSRIQILINTALENNRDLKILAQKVKSALVSVSMQRSQSHPEIFLSLSEKAQSQPKTSLQLLEVGVSHWEVDLFGRLDSLTKAEAAKYLASKETQIAAKISLIASIIHCWLDALANEDLSKLIDKIVVSQKKSLELSKLRFESGLLSEVDLHTIETLFLSTRTRQEQHKRLQAQNLNHLAWLLGAPIPESVADTQAFSGLSGIQFPDISPGSPQELIFKRHDIRSAEQELIATHAKIESARYAMLPLLSLKQLAFMGGHDSFSPPGANTLGFGWSIIPHIALSLFDTKADMVKLSKFQRDIALAQYEKNIQMAFREVSDSLVTKNTLSSELTATIEEANAAERKKYLVSISHEKGSLGQLDLLEAERNLFAAQQKVIAVKLALLKSQVTLYKALGGSLD